MLVMVVVGCGRNELGLVPVEGVVTLDGQPLADARVIFRPFEGGRPSSGVTDADGNFKLVYSEDQTGALPGKHHVSVSTLVEADPDSSDPLVKTGQKERVPAKYNSKTTLEADLDAGNESLTFDLKSM